MYTRFTDFVRRVDPLLAFRQSRFFAAGIGGTFFALGNICKIPLKNFLSGYGPAITTGLISLVNLGYNMLDNYRNSDPESVADTIKAYETVVTTRIILEKLNTDNVKAHDFLKKYSITDEAIAKIDDWKNVDVNELMNILDELYDETIRFDFTKYTAAVSYGIINAACHMMEFMLVQAFHDKTTFDYGDHPTAGNVILSIAMVLALCNGVATLLDVKAQYEKPSVAKRCDTIFKLFNSHHVLSQQSVESNDHPAALEMVATV